MEMVFQRSLSVSGNCQVGEFIPENDKFPHNEKNSLAEHDRSPPWKQQQGQLSPPVQRLDINLPAFHTLIAAGYSSLTYAEPHIWTTKGLGYSLFIYSSEYWRDYSKTQRKELSLPLARHLLCSSLEGSQEIRQPLSPRNQFWCPLQRLASNAKLVTNSILPSLHVHLTGEWQSRADEAFADKHTRSLCQHMF